MSSLIAGFAISRTFAITSQTLKKLKFYSDLFCSKNEIYLNLTTNNGSLNILL